MKVEYKEIIRIMIAFISLINTSFIFFFQYAQTGDYFGSVSTIFQPKIPDISLCQVQQILWDFSENNWMIKIFFIKTL